MNTNFFVQLETRNIDDQVLLYGPKMALHDSEVDQFKDSSHVERTDGWVADLHGTELVIRPTSRYTHDILRGYYLRQFQKNGGTQEQFSTMEVFGPVWLTLQALEIARNKYMARALLSFEEKHAKAWRIKWATVLGDTADLSSANLSKLMHMVASCV